MSAMKNPENATCFTALAAEVARGVLVKDAAKIVGVSHHHAYDISCTPEFKRRVNQMRTAMIEGTVARLVKASEKAVETLEDCLPDKERDSKWLATAKVRMAAAKSLLSVLLPLADNYDIRQRLDALEERKDGSDE